MYVYKYKIKKEVEMGCQGDGFLDTNEIPLNNGDLGAVLHIVSVYIDAYRNRDGSWTAAVALKDTFDFTEFEDPRNQDSIKSALLWTANDIAYLDTEWGLLDPVDVIITYSRNY